MTSLQVPYGTDLDKAERNEGATPLWSIVVICALALLAASAPNLLDPLIRHDDYPALLGMHEMYYTKTLTEGRWINYLWHQRDVITPSWLNFAIYQIVWATFGAGLAVTALGRHTHPLYTVLLAVLIVIAPPALMISMWFNTLFPSMVIIATFAIMGCYLSPRQMRLWLIVFVPFTMMAYTTFPVFLLAVCLVHRDAEHTIRELTTLVGTFIAVFAGGLLLIYALNYWEHGVFGVVMSDIRAANPATDLASLWANFLNMRETAEVFFIHITFDFRPALYFHAFLLTAATLFLLQTRPMLVLYIYTGLAIGIGLIVLQGVRSGIVIGSRGMIYVWSFYALLVVLATIDVAEQSALKGRLMRNAAILIAGSYLLQTAVVYAMPRAWQADTRALAAQIDQATPGPLFIRGHFRALPSHANAGIQHQRGVYLRMVQLTGRDVVLCKVNPQECPDMPKDAGAAGPAVVYDTDKGPMLVLDHVWTTDR